MIISVHTAGWGSNSQTLAWFALQENLVLFTKDAEGSFQKVTSLEAIQRDTPLFIELEMFLDAYFLAQHFDLMLREFGKEGVCLAVDSKGGSFKQR